MLKKEGIDVGFIQIKLLHPFPGEYVKSLLKEAKTIIDIEANHSGQLGKIFQQNISREIDYYILKYTGRGMTSTEIYDSLKKIIQNKAVKKGGLESWRLNLQTIRPTSIMIGVLDAVTLGS